MRKIKLKYLFWTADDFTLNMERRLTVQQSASDSTISVKTETGRVYQMDGDTEVEFRGAPLSVNAELVQPESEKCQVTLSFLVQRTLQLKDVPSDQKIEKEYRDNWVG